MNLGSIFPGGRGNGRDYHWNRCLANCGKIYPVESLGLCPECGKKEENKKLGEFLSFLREKLGKDKSREIQTEYEKKYPSEKTEAK